MTADEIVQRFATAAARHPERPLAVTPRRSASAGEVAAAAAAIDARLRADRPPPGALLLLAAPTGPGFLAGFLGARRAGLVPVLCDVALRPAERRRIAGALGVWGLLATAAPFPEEAAAWELERAAAAQDETALGAAPHGTGAVKLTSGSTGEPRGIAVSTAALLADEAQLAASMGLEAGGAYLAALPLSHSYGFASLALPALVRDVHLVIPEGGSPLAPLHAARTCSAAFFPTVPAWLDAAGRLAEPPGWPPSVRLVISAGAVLPPAVAARFRSVYGRCVHVFYGASETGGICYDRSGEAAERGTVGAPVAGVEVAIEPEEGRVVVRSAAVATSYLPAPAAELAGGRFRTGDLGELEAGGELRLVGRADDLLKIKGKNVNPREVEAVLAELAGVEEVAVLGMAGAGGPLLRAVIACGPAALDDRRVRDHCRVALAEHKRPRSVVLVRTLPRTARGKIDREALLALSGGGEEG